SIQFPGDPITNPAATLDRSWVIGHTWIISPTKVNQFVYGESRAEFDAIANLSGPASPGANPAIYAGLNWLFATGITPPFARPGGNTALNPEPTFRDDFTWTHGRHQFQFGGVWRPIKTRSVLQNNLVFTNQGLDTINNLDPSQRPSDILNDPNGIAASNWDSAFTSFTSINVLQVSVYNYVKHGNVSPTEERSQRDYRYYKTEC